MFAFKDIPSSLSELAAAPWAAIGAIALIIYPTIHFYTSKMTFQKGIRGQGGLPSVAPYAFPCIGHTRAFASGEEKMAFLFLWVLLV
jgi:hypothetical protein